MKLVHGVMTKRDDAKPLAIEVPGSMSSGSIYEHAVVLQVELDTVIWDLEVAALEVAEQEEERQAPIIAICM